MSSLPIIRMALLPFTMKGDIDCQWSQRATERNTQCIMAEALQFVQLAATAAPSAAYPRAAAAAAAGHSEAARRHLHLKAAAAASPAQRAAACCP